MPIPIAKPYFNKKEGEVIKQVLDSGWVVQGPKVAEFEKRFAKFTGVKYAVATTSCTTALHLSLTALGVKVGDEVIVPAYTFVATANAVEQLGAKPVFVDIDPQTYNINPALIEAAITPKTKAIIPVHLFGLSADMKPIMKLAKKHNLRVIEDAACGLGSYYRNKHVGAFGNAGCFSFHPRKIITTGEGGMITANNKKLADKLRSLRNHGAAISDLKREQNKIALLPDYRYVGFNYRMTDLQAAIGIEQLKKFSAIAKRRQQQAKLYNQFLAQSNFGLPTSNKKTKHAYQSYVINVYNANLRNQLLKQLSNAKINARQGTHSVPHLKYFRKKYGYTDKDFSASIAAENTSLALPLFHQLTPKEQKRISTLCAA